MASRRLPLAALCATLACGRTPAALPPSSPPRLAGTTRHYRPLEMRSDATLPGQLVILGTDDADGSLVLPLPRAPAAGVVDALFVNRGARPPTGGLIAVTVAMGPSATITGVRSGEPADATASGAPGASGASGARDDASWQAALSSAALVAATALGKDLGELTFSAAPQVPAGDAGASALLAGGFVATVIGAPIDPAATLAGTVNPDGTIGPVAGLPEQFLAALARGKTRLGYPTGMRIARSLATGRDVDLVQLARAHHAEAIELASVRDAYALLTHEHLPGAVPVTEADMALDAGTLDGLGTRYLAWQKRLADQWALLLQLEQAGRLPAVVTRLVHLAHRQSERAEALYRAGKHAAAYRRILAAWLYATTANDTYGLLRKLQSGDVAGAEAALAALAAAASSSAVLTRIGELRPTTLAGHLAMIAALQTALRGWSHRALADEALRTASQLVAGLRDQPRTGAGAAAALEPVANAVAPAVLVAYRTVAEMTAAEQELELSPDRGVAYTCSPTARLAETFYGAATAAVRYGAALVVEPLARRAQISDDAARQRVALDEPDYAIADQLIRLDTTGALRELAAAWGADSPAANLLPLAAYQLVYRSAALLIARHGSLAVHDPSRARGEPTVLARLLGNARHSARANARAARVAIGEIPLASRLAYQLAASDETATLEDQLDALAELWTASALAQTAVMLARH